MPLVHKRLKAVVTTGAAAALCAGALAAASPSQATPRSAIPDTHPSWASASARVSASAVTTGTVNARVYLAGQNAAGLAAYATAVSTPGSADYGHYLSAAQVKAEFGPTSAQIAAVEVLADRRRAHGDLGQRQRRRVRRGERLGQRRRQGVQRDVPELQGPGQADRPGAGADGQRPGLGGQRRAHRDRPGHGEAPDEAGRHAAAAGSELLGRRAVLAVLRAEDRHHRAARVRQEASPGTTAGTPRRRSAAPTG